MSNWYLKLVQATGNKRTPIRVVPKYRGDDQPFNASVGDFAINRPAETADGEFMLDHGQQLSLSQFNHVLSLNQQSPMTLKQINQDTKSLSQFNNQLAFTAPLNDKSQHIDISKAQAAKVPFDSSIQNSLEQASSPAHGMVNALHAVNAKMADTIKADDTYQFGQYHESVVDKVPANYFTQHPLPIGQALDNTKVKSMLFNGHTMVMQSVRQKTNDAFMKAISQPNGLLKSNVDNNSLKPSQSNLKQTVDPFAFDAHMNQVDGFDVQANSATTNLSANMESQLPQKSLSQALNDKLAELTGQRFKDHQRIKDDGNSDNDSASEFEDDYEPRDFADAESALQFQKAKGKLLGDDKATERTKYLTNLLNTRNAVTQENDDSLLEEEMSNDNDDITINDKDNSDVAKKARQDKKLKSRQRQTTKRKQMELYAQSVYAMKYHDDHGNVKLQYNMIPCLRDTHAFVNTAQFEGLTGTSQTHSMPISKANFDSIMAANGHQVSTKQVLQAVDHGQAIAGKHDNIAFAADLQPSKHGVKIADNSIAKTERAFNYQQEIEHGGKGRHFAFMSPGIKQVANPIPNKFSADKLMDPHTSTQKEYNQLQQAFANLSLSSSHTKSVSHSISEPSLNR